MQIFEYKKPCGLLSVFLALAAFQTNQFFKYHERDSDAFQTVYVWLLAALAILLVKRIKITGAVAKKIICVMGSCAFGVYLIEDVVRNQVQRTMPAIVPFLGRFWAGMVFTVLSVLISMLVIYLVRKIPWVKKLI